jgi:hypothetical protein
LTRILYAAAAAAEPPGPRGTHYDDEEHPIRALGEVLLGPDSEVAPQHTRGLESEPFGNSQTATETVAQVRGPPTQEVSRLRATRRIITAAS